MQCFSSITFSHLLQALFVLLVVNGARAGSSVGEWDHIQQMQDDCSALVTMLLNDWLIWLQIFPYKPAFLIPISSCTMHYAILFALNIPLYREISLLYAVTYCYYSIKHYIMDIWSVYQVLPFWVCSVFESTIS